MKSDQSTFLFRTRQVTTIPAIPPPKSSNTSSTLLPCLGVKSCINSSIGNDASAEGIYGGNGGTYGALFIKIKKSRMPGWSDSWTDAEKAAAFKTWLSSNPPTILYPLASPQVVAGMHLTE